MRYLALGDSMSIDEYTGVKNGGAASQFAAGLPASAFNNQARDGFTTSDVLRTIDRMKIAFDVITLTVGGNDLLRAALTDPAPVTAEEWRVRARVAMFDFQVILGRMVSLAGGFSGTGKLIFNTVYDPTDGDDERLREMGLPVAARAGLEAYNEAIRSLISVILVTIPIAPERILLCDAARLFRGHGYWSKEPFLTQMIEPNIAGATALADEWLRLVRRDVY